MQTLSKKYLLENSNLVNSKNPVSLLLNLPEKVLQFGTGVLLRGLPDFIIDQANKQGLFNGRIVVVKSTAKGSIGDFTKQDNLYTVCVRGIKAGHLIEENHINTAISRVLEATSQWQEILKFAESTDLKVVISNTTEVGIVMEEEDIKNSIPITFPGKLLAILYHRFKYFKGEKGTGLVIIPTELISNNGDTLRKIIIELANYNQLEEDFKEWLISENTFCNSLVDRIVPGSPKGDSANNIQRSLNYIDELKIVAEPYTLWAISGDEKVAKTLSFTQASAGAFVEKDITKFKELKLRLLNGTHSLTCALAYLSEFSTVKEAMNNPDFFNFISKLIFEEIGKAIPYPLSGQEIEDFGHQVLDRFKNPFIDHYWINISLNYTEKIKLRILPLLLAYHEKYKKVPQLMAIGLAAYIRFMQPFRKDNKQYFGEYKNHVYLLQDPQAAIFEELYQNNPIDLVYSVLSDLRLWGTDLTKIEDLTASISEYFLMLKQGKNLLTQ